MITIQVVHSKTLESFEAVFSPDLINQGGGLIGRNPKCDLVLSSPEVSRVHGRILYVDGQYYFTDLGSTDGSQVNNQVIQTNQNVCLQPGDVIYIGEFTLLIKEIDPAAPSGSLSTSNTPTPSGLTATPAFEIKALETKLLILQADDLQQYASSAQEGEIIVQGRHLVEGVTLSPHLHVRAMELCQAELNAGRFCVLVEYPAYLTIWQEKVN